MTRRWPYVAAACVHLLLVISVASRDTFAVFAGEGTILPEWARRVSRKGEAALACVLGTSSRLPEWWWGQPIALYLHAAGSESGYGFFAPNVPDSYRLVFELHYLDGRIEYESPQGAATGSEMRMASLVDMLGHLQSRVVREGILRLLVQDRWRQHADVSMIRVFLGIVTFPTMDQYRDGMNASCRVLYTYDTTDQVGQPRKP